MAVIPIKDLGRPVQAGDTLLIRPDLTAHEEYLHKFYKIYCAPEMASFAGRTAVVTRYTDGEILVDLDYNEWYWSNDMFSGVLVPDEDLGDISGDDVSLNCLFGGTL